MSWFAKQLSCDKYNVASLCSTELKPANKRQAIELVVVFGIAT